MSDSINHPHPLDAIASPRASHVRFSLVIAPCQIYLARLIIGSAAAAAAAGSAAPVVARMRVVVFPRMRSVVLARMCSARRIAGRRGSRGKGQWERLARDGIANRRSRLRRRSIESLSGTPYNFLHCPSFRDSLRGRMAQNNYFGFTHGGTQYG